MILLHRLIAVARWLLHRHRAETDLHDELQSFIDLAADDAVRDGTAPAEARRMAALQLGGVEQTKERVRAARRGAWLDQLGRDLRSGVRQIRRNPAFSTVAIATLALGIGVNTAMFGAADAVLLRPLPYAHADRLVMVWDDATRTGGEPKFFSTPPEWNEWRRQNTVFTDVAASEPAEAALSGVGEPEELPARKVTGNFWSVLGAQPIVGRVFTEAEDAQAARVVVISDGLWQRRFGGSPDVVGRSITLNDTPYRVIGVMPRGFYFLPSSDIDVWMPASISPAMLKNWGWHDVLCVARLRPGVSLAQAQDAMAGLSLRVSAQHVPIARSAVVTAVRSELAGRTYVSMIVLLAAAGAVLLIACVNLAALLMARGIVRGREVTVRTALGAGRGRLITQFLIESVVLAAFGTVAGLVVALPAMRFLETLMPSTMPAVHLALDARVLAVSAATAMAAAVIFGAVPACRGSRVRLQDALRDGSRGTTGRRSYRLQHALIVIETALAVALLTNGGLLLQTLEHLQRLDLGIRTDGLLTFVTPLFHHRTFDERVAFVNAELEKIRAVPGVVGAGAISRVPLTVNDQATYYRLTGQSFAETNAQVALSRVVTRDYFATVGAHLRDGRFFDASDQRSDAPVAIVNESFANRHFPGRSPIGARFQFGNRGPKGYWYTIVGVVKEMRDRGVAEELQPTIYRVHEQADQSGDQPTGIVVRTIVPPASVVAPIRRAIWSIDANEPIAQVQTIDDIVARQLSVPSRNTIVLGAFALLAMLLASIGLYGVLSYAVAQRTNDIGVHMALGATSRHIVISIGGRGLILATSGVAMGAILALMAARALRTLLFDFEPNEMTAVLTASLLLLAVATIASLVPARRASRIDPVVALQQD